jgi:hypothetical protein
MLYTDTTGIFNLYQDVVVNSKKEKTARVHNDDLITYLKKDYDRLSEDNRNLKLVVLKILTQINIYEYEVLKRDSEVNVTIL